jgi:hypothetical protein
MNRSQLDQVPCDGLRTGAASRAGAIRVSPDARRLPGAGSSSLSIAAMWLAVLFTAIFGPDIRSIDAGGNSTTIPSVVPVALFGTMAVAKHGFDKKAKDA